jgi:hypothetical protein
LNAFPHECNALEGADISHASGYINPARHVRAFGVAMGQVHDGIDTIERRAE